MGTGYTSVLLLPAWLLRKLGAAELAQLLAEPGGGGAVAAPAPAATAGVTAATAPSPRQLARRQRRKRQRERRRASRGAGEDALPSDDQVDGGSAVALSQADSGVVSAVRGGGKRTRSSLTPASSPAASMSHSPSVCGAVVCGGGSPSAAAPAAAGPQKRKRAGGGSAEGGSSDVCRPSAVEDVHGRVSALAESVREELLHGGVPASDIRLRPLMLGDKLLPQFPVVRGGCAEKAVATALAGSVQSVDPAGFGCSSV